MSSKSQCEKKKKREKLGSYLTISKARNKNDQCTAVYSVTNSQGFVPSADYFSKEVFSKELRTYKIVERGMIAYNPSRINVGSVALQDVEDRVVVSPLYVVFSIDNTAILPEYVLHFLKSRSGQSQIAFLLTGTVRNNLKFDALCNMGLTIPSLDTQQEQIKFLTTIERLLNAYGRYLSKLDDLVKSRFIEMFGDYRLGTCPMGDLIKKINSGTNVSGQQRQLEDHEYAVLKVSSITQGVFNSKEYKVVDDISGIKMIHPQKGDLLFSRANTTEMVGATAIVDDNYWNLFLPDKIWRLDPKDDVEPAFLKYLLSTNAVRNEMSRVATGTSGSMQNISMAKFRKLGAFKPEKNLQEEFASFVSQIDKVKAAVQQSIDKLQILYDSLAQEYFG